MGFFKDVFGNGLEERIESNPSLMRLVEKVSDTETQVVFVGLDRVEIIPFGYYEYQQKKEKGKNPKKEIKKYVYKFSKHGYNNLDKLSVRTLAGYIGKKCFHGDYKCADKTELVDFTPSDSTLVGYTLNISGTGLAPVTSYSGSDGERVFRGVNVYNVYGSRLLEKQKADREEAQKKKKRDLF